MKSTLNIHWKDWCWKCSNILATWWEELTHQKRPWCRERLKAGGEGEDRGWDAWMASLTQWAWVWVNSGSWWWTGRPGVLQSMGSQTVGHDWATEQQHLYQRERIFIKIHISLKNKTTTTGCQVPATARPTAGFLHVFLTFCFPGILLPTSDNHVKIWEVSLLASRGFLPTVYKHHNI